MYFPPITDMITGLLRGSERLSAEVAGKDAARATVEKAFGRDVRQAARVQITNGPRRVDMHPLGGQGSYVRQVEVVGSSRERILAALPGPATGPNGFAPHMVSETPVSRQFHADGTVRAEQTRIPGLPAAMGATVSGRPTANGMAFQMRDGLTTGDFTLDVGPERTLADGRKTVTVTEAGHFSLMRGKPISLAMSPFYLLANFTPMGWLMQATGGAAVSDAHIGLFQLADVLRKRLNAAR